MIERVRSPKTSSKSIPSLQPPFALLGQPQLLGVKMPSLTMSLSADSAQQ